MCLFNQFPLIPFVIEWIPPALFLFHDGWLESILLGFATPSCYMLLCCIIILHSKSSFFLYTFFLCKFFPFGGWLFIRDSLTPWKQNRNFRQFKVEFGSLKIVNLLLLGQWLSGRYFLLFCIYGCLKCIIDIWYHSLSY